MEAKEEKIAKTIILSFVAGLVFAFFAIPTYKDEYALLLVQYEELQKDFDRLAASKSQPQSKIDKTSTAYLEQKYQGYYIYMIADRITVEQKYLRYIEKINGRLRFTMESSQKVGPNIDVIYLNNSGYITGERKLYWIIEEISPGETRTHELSMDDLKNGEAVYIGIKFVE